MLSRLYAAINHVESQPSESVQDIAEVVHNAVGMSLQSFEISLIRVRYTVLSFIWVLFVVLLLVEIFRNPAFNLLSCGGPLPIIRIIHGTLKIRRRLHYRR